MEKSNYLIKLTSNLNPAESLKVVRYVINPKISAELQAIFGCSHSIGTFLTNGEIPMNDLGSVLLVTSPGEDSTLHSRGISCTFYLLKTLGVISLSDDNKTLRVNLTAESLETHWNAMSEWISSFEHHLFGNLRPGRELQTKIMASAVFQGFYDGATIESGSLAEFRDSLKAIFAAENDKLVPAVAEFAKVLREILAAPGPDHGVLGFSVTA